MTFFMGATAQPVQWGSSGYIEYQQGTLPLVISVPHGGEQEPASIPNRTCNNAVLVTDANTVEVALAIKSSLYALTGCYPHIIVCHLHRSKLDCNRNLSDGACGNTTAGQAWSEFHNFINVAQNTAQAAYPSKVFFMDLHGHGNPIQRIELGYLLYDDELALTDSTLNTPTYIGYSSIRHLANNNVGNLNHAQLLRGSTALGTRLGNGGYPSVPSQQIPMPGLSTNYYSGGYILANHSSYVSGILTDGVQMELNFTGIRDTPTNISRFADSAAVAIVNYLNLNLGFEVGGCAPSAVEAPGLQSNLSLAPNPLKPGEKPRFLGLTSTIIFELYNGLGACVWRGEAHHQDGATNWPFLKPGLYWMRVSSNFNPALSCSGKVSFPLLIQE